MADYTYAPDNKLHTRYSELLKCSPGSLDRIIQDRQNPDHRFESDSMLDGTLRHEAFEEEARKTGKLPKCFGLDWPVSHIEHEFTTEMFPGIIVHSRPDTVCADVQAVTDYKTVLDGVHGWKYNVAKYRDTSKQRQLFFYAYQLGLHGIRITRGIFLLEIWNKERDTILGYEIVEFPITLKDMASAVQWAKPRAYLLASVLEEVLI